MHKPMFPFWNCCRQRYKLFLQKYILPYGLITVYTTAGLWIDKNSFKCLNEVLFSKPWTRKTEPKSERQAIIFQRSDTAKTKCVDDRHVSCSIRRLVEVNLQTNQKKTTETESEGLRIISKGIKFFQFLFVIIIKTMCVCSAATKILLSGICYGGKMLPSA